MSKFVTAQSGEQNILNVSISSFINTGVRFLMEKSSEKYYTHMKNLHTNEN